MSDQRSSSGTQVNMVRVLLPLLILVNTIALTSCGDAQNPHVTTSASTATGSLAPEIPTATPPSPVAIDWQFRWLQKVPCSAPCVEGITPGITTASEAIELLTHNALVTNVSKNPNFDAGHRLGAIFWDWVNWAPGGSALYQADNSASILRIIPEFGRDYSLRQVMKSYGEPTFILATAGYLVSERPIYSQDVTLLWLPYGFTLHSYGSQLDEDARFGLLVFFAPTLEAFEAGNSTALRHPDWLLPWEGFKGFQYYCRDSVNGKACRGEQPPP